MFEANSTVISFSLGSREESTFSSELHPHCSFCVSLSKSAASSFLSQIMKNARSQASPRGALVDALLLCTTQHSLSPIFSPCSGDSHGLFLLPVVCSRIAGPCILLQSAPSTGNYLVHKLVMQFFNGSVLPSMSHQSAAIWLWVCRF